MGHTAYGLHTHRKHGKTARVIVGLSGFKYHRGEGAKSGGLLWAGTGLAKPFKAWLGND